MTVTKDLVLARRRELEGDLKALEQKIQAVFGAIQDCDFWLGQLDEPEETGKMEPSG